MSRSDLSLPAPGLASGTVASVWHGALWRLGGTWLVLLALFRSDWAAMVRQWWQIDTYNHILFIPPILVWLVYQRRERIGRLTPVAWWPALGLVAGAALAWLLGALAMLDLARQLGAVLLLIAAALLWLGPKVGVGLAFPLGYMLLLVPFGDELVRTLQMVTAAIVIALVDLAAIPATIDGVFIDTPAGLFEVAEACSGVKFLVAMVAFGLLLANLCFTSWKRRAAVLAACVIVPVLANGVRAFGTIFLAQFVGAEMATGFDHIVYGWIFFAIVVALVIAGAWRFFDRPADDPPIDAEAIAASPFLGRSERRRIGPAGALAGLLLIVLGANAWASAAQAVVPSVPKQIFLPQVEGWQRVDYVPTAAWEPRAKGAAHRLLGRYADSEGREVDVFVALYAMQGEGAEAGGQGEGALMAGGDWSWQSSGPVLGGAASQRLLEGTGARRVAATWYRTGDMTSASAITFKLATLADRLLLRARPAIVLILSAEERDGVSADEAIAAFHEAVEPLDQWMDRAAGLK